MKEEIKTLYKINSKLAIQVASALGYNIKIKGMTMKEYDLFVKINKLSKDDYVYLWHKGVKQPYKGKLGEPFKVPWRGVKGYKWLVPFTDRSGKVSNVRLFNIIGLEVAA